MVNITNIALIILGFSAISLVGIPDQKNLEESPVQTVLMDIPVISDLKISNQDLTGLTLNWISGDHADVSNYKIYQDAILLATVPGSTHEYDVTGLKADKWYEFSVEACTISDECGRGPVLGVNTPSVQGEVESIISDVNNLVSTGVLDQKQGNDLISDLTIIYQYPDNVGTVRTHLADFSDKMNSLITSGVLSHEMGQTILNSINKVINNIY